jgi:hypothetical protein
MEMEMEREIYNRRMKSCVFRVAGSFHDSTVVKSGRKGIDKGRSAFLSQCTPSVYQTLVFCL